MSAAFEAAAAPEFEERRIRSADGLSLYVRDYPPVAPMTGAPVFCLHGLTRNSKDFSLVAPRIAALGRRTLAWDTRGRGQSERDPEPQRYNPAIYVQDALRVLDELAIERAVFIGTSMGGIITMVLAAMAPQRVAGAILNDIGAEIDPAGLRRIAQYVGKTGAVTSWEEAANACKRVNGVAFPDADDAFWMRFAHNTFRARPDGAFEPDYDPAIAASIQPPVSDQPAQELKPYFQALAQAAPVMVVRGALSDLLSPAGVAGMREIDPDLVVAEAPRVGHAPMLEEAEAWDAMLDFLARLP
ncbi:MAG: alpha/beta fold hydrolase [Hyphomonadaceae bacterium]